MRIRRLHACSCSEAQARTFSSLFTNMNPITPELRCLTAKMAALLPFGKAADFLGGLLPLPAQTTAGTVRNRTMKVGRRFQKTAELSWSLRRPHPLDWSSAWMVSTLEIDIRDRSEPLKSLPVRC
jgi:hypothetical protein